MMAMFMKVHKNDHKIVAVCDEDLIGKVLESKELYLDLDRYRGFYVGEKTKVSKVKEELREFDSANLVGRRSVAIAIDLGLAGRKDVMYIKTTPYIQIYRL